MIRIEKFTPTNKTSSSKKNWAILSCNPDTNEITKLHELNLINSSLTNKFTIVQSLIDEMNELNPAFASWYEGMIKGYIDSNFNSDIIVDNMELFTVYAAEYVKHKNIDYSQFIKIEKKSSTSILFDEKDMFAIGTSSTAIKLYAIFLCDPTFKLSPNADRVVFAKLLEPCYSIETTTKVFQMLRSKTYNSSITDKSMWEIIKAMCMETPETHAMEVFNFLMRNLLSTMEIDANPVPFMTRVMDKSIRWLMKSVYNDKIVYGEVYGTSAEISGANQRDEFYIKCCNDVIEKAAAAGMRLLNDIYELDEDQFVDFRSRLDNMTHLTPLHKRLTLPIASKVLEIPYNYLESAPVKHIILLSILMHECSKDVLDGRYPILADYLIGAPKDPKVIPVKSTYKIKNIESFINDDNRLFGFSTKFLRYEILSSLCGALSSSKRNLISIIDGKPLTKVTYADLEGEAVSFFNEYYSNNLEIYFESMREKVDSHL